MIEICGEFTVDRSTASRWANCFRGGCVSLEYDTTPGRPRTSRDERSVMLVADAFEKIIVQHVNNFLGPWEQNLRRKMHKDRPQLLVAGQHILHDNARPHIAEVVAKKLCLYGWEELP